MINNYITSLFEEGHDQKALSIMEEIDKYNKSQRNYLEETDDEWDKILNQE